MRPRTSRLGSVVSLLAAGAVLAACGDDATGPGDTALSPDEAREIAEEVTREIAVFGFAGGGSSGPPDVSARSASADVASTIDIESECAGGGTVAISGEFLDDPESGSSRLEAELVYDECTRTSSDRAITLTTRPAFDLTSDVQPLSDTEMEMASSLSGPFDWDVDGESGSCDLEIDSILAAEVSSDGTAVTVSATTVGQICGHEIDRSFESTVAAS